MNLGSATNSINETFFFAGLLALALIAATASSAQEIELRYSIIPQDQPSVEVQHALLNLP